MKIIEMERITMDGEPLVYDTLNECAGEYRDYWCVLENETEEKLYEETWNSNETDLIPTWNKLVNEAGKDYNLCWGDDELYGYVHYGETKPIAGETFVDGDGDEWKLVS